MNRAGRNRAFIFFLSSVTAKSILGPGRLLPPNYVIFAKVIAGFDVVDAIANIPTTMGDDGGMSKPLTPPVIKTVTIKP
jgi:cyclophilin family peptidyl-prolyl cis-trans isomerase